VPDHPHLVVPEVRPDATGRPVCVAPVPAHGLLAGLLRRRPVLTPPEVAMVAVTIARALAALHASGRPHGAVRAEHVLLGVEARPLLDAAPLAAAVRRGHTEADDIRDLGQLLAECAGDDLPMALRVLVSAARDPDPALRPSAVDLVRSATAAVPAAPLRLRPDDPDDVVPALRGRAARRGGRLRWARAVARQGQRPRWLVALLVGGSVLGLVLLGLVVRGRPGSAAAAEPPEAPAVSAGSSATAAASPASTADAADWVTVLDAIDSARSDAFGTLDPALLTEADVPGSPADRSDRAALARLAAAGVRARGFTETVRAVRVLQGSPGRAVLAVRDERPAYTLVDSTGAVVGRQPGRGLVDWQVVLAKDGAGWRTVDVAQASVATACSSVACRQ
jgi:hypothetical protein